MLELLKLREDDPDIVTIPLAPPITASGVKWI